MPYTVPFCCGGWVTENKPVSIWYRTTTTVATLELPTQDKSSIEMLAGACDKASFGIKDKQVHDPNYRNSLKLEADQFKTSFEVSAHGILEEARRLLFPNVETLSATLYKLNLYKKGHFFKPHVDTPRSSAMVASLVVCLPLEHEGGDLIVKHGNRVQNFQFSTKKNEVGWAVFYSNCEHEVKELTSGYRITLTYNLHALLPSKPKHELALGSDLYNHFLGLKQQNVHRKLGYPCEHLYALENANDVISVLKGQDAHIYAAASAAGLEVMVCRVWQNPKTDDYGAHEAGDIIDDNFDGPLVSDYCLGDDQCYRNESIVDGPSDSDVDWQGCLSFDVGGSCMHYGNEHTSQAIYCAAAIIVTVDGQDESESDDGEDESESY